MVSGFTCNMHRQHESTVGQNSFRCDILSDDQSIIKDMMVYIDLKLFFLSISLSTLMTKSR